jgi:methylated-DNA-[protein]-cysteine S-methyltransferase
MNTLFDFTRIESPLGAMLLVATDAALTGVYFDGQRHQPPIGAQWRERPDAALLRDTARQLVEYFSGARRHFELPLAPLGTPFQRGVWNAIGEVPPGETISYRELAFRAGRPGSARAAGTATGRNPLSILIPCHRIVGSDGAPTGYAGGLERKRALLALERRFRETAPQRRIA